MAASLVDTVDHTTGEVIPVDLALRHGDQSDASVPEGLDPEPRFYTVEPAEPVLVPAKDDLEVTFFLCVPDHPLELDALFRGVARHTLVILPDDLAPVLFGQLRHFGPLLVRAGLLLTAGHTDVCHSGG